MLAYTDSNSAGTAAIIVGVILVLIVILLAVALFLLVMRKPCPSCKARVPRGASVCSKCGRDIATA